MQNLQLFFYYHPPCYRDWETIERIGEVYYINTHGDILKEIETNNEKIDKSKERERDDMVHELAKDMKTAILKEF